MTHWDTLAAEYARRGDHAQAYAMARKAGIAREQAQQKEAGNRAVAMAARLEIERARAEREQVREQAALAAQRASLLQATHTTLEQLGRIGREITAQLDVDTVFSRIYGHLHALVDAPHLSIGPLQVRGRIIGALSIQSERTEAYGARERLVFRSACAWAAIALDNGAVVAELQRTRRQLQLAGDAERYAREQAEQATQLKGEFLANISHDLRTPLASLQGYLETLLLEPGAVTDADRARYLDAALAQSAKVNHLAAELSDLAQLESGAMQPALARFSIADLLIDVVRKLELAVSGRSQRVLLHLPRELPDALADAGMIERVLTNLLDNAVQHAPQGSEIRVEICTGLGAERGQLRVTVLDTGPGIPAELRAGLFSGPSPGAQAHRPGGGGLGLLIVQRLLQQHGSEIRLVQRAGYGAAFSFGVPCVRLVR